MRIGIVNDSVMACEVLRRVVLSMPGQEVAWIARDGVQGARMAQADRPDLVLMDLFMPEMDGVECTRRIMHDSPCAILVVTATVSGHISKVYQAMGYGALDAVDTPVLGPSGGVAGAASLLHKIEVIGMLMGKQPSRPACAPAAAPVGTAARKAALEPLVLIGASTGGPFALAEILAGLPAALKANIVIVQHVDAAFVRGLGQWLSEYARREVRLVDEGTWPAGGRVLLSGTDDHLVLGPDHHLHYSAEPQSSAYRPSVDVLFTSAARNWSRPGVAVLLTGMGRDGAEGLLELRQRGWKTVAQDESTSVVWGMPRAAVERGAAELVLPLPRIAQAIVSLLEAQTSNPAQAQPLTAGDNERN